jgi:hypothetical protein
MTNEIVQGDSGSIIELVIQDDSQVIDLTDATVQIVLTYKSTGKIIQAEITDPVKGVCQFTLTSEDTMYEGIHTFQATVTFSDGRKFTSNTQRFNVAKKIGFIPSTGGGGGGNTEIISGVNGHILVNGLDVKVYDDSTVKTDIIDLKNSKHAHSNLSVLNQLTTDGTYLLFNGSKIVGGLGSEIVQSETNGYVKVDGIDVKVFDTTDLQNEISNKQPLGDYATNIQLSTGLSQKAEKGVTDAHENRINSIENSDVIKRLGVSSNGKLTIDGVEVTLDDPTSPIDGGTFTTTYNTNIVDGGEF